MRISDWSSDVCSSDLTSIYYVMLALTALLMQAAANLRRSVQGRFLIAARDAPEAVEHFGASATRPCMGIFFDRKSVASGTSVYVLVDLGGLRIIQKKT